METDPVTPHPVDPTSASRASREPFLGDFRFRTHERIPGGSDFRRAMKQGRRRTGRFLVLWSYPRPDANRPATRLGLCLGRRHGSAVERNLFKRRVREIFRRNKALIPRGWDLVTTPRAPSPSSRFPPAFEDLRRDFLDLVRRSLTVPSDQTR